MAGIPVAVNVMSDPSLHTTPWTWLVPVEHSKWMVNIRGIKRGHCATMSTDYDCFQLCYEITPGIAYTKRKEKKDEL